ncbi:MAG: hypothetical protein KY475_15880, partial [Planctomycetes bacterium]|nr:hypothetical protein [Planctomycetota bacterium]
APLASGVAHPSTVADELRRSEKMLGRSRRITRLYVTGGGARLHGLLRRVMHLGKEGDLPAP